MSNICYILNTVYVWNSQTFLNKYFSENTKISIYWVFLFVWLSRQCFPHNVLCRRHNTLKSVQSRTAVMKLSVTEAVKGSAVWRWFGFKRSAELQSTIICKLRLNKIATKDGSTINLFPHLKRHANQYKECIKLSTAQWSTKVWWHLLPQLWDSNIYTFNTARVYFTLQIRTFPLYTFTWGANLGGMFHQVCHTK